MTVIELRDLLNKEIEQGHGDATAIISVGVDDGDFGYDEEHDVTGTCFYSKELFGRDMVEIEKSYA